jgi:very-short-patch-repair endonuclease
MVYLEKANEKKKELKQKKEKEFLKNCLYCNKPINYLKRNNKFCNRSCSTSHNNTKRKIQITDKLKELIINDYLNYNMIYTEIENKYSISFSIVREILKGLSTSGQKMIKRNTQLKSHSDETKKLMSEKKLLFLQNNPDKHNWKKNNRLISIPCEKLKTDLKLNNISFIEEYQPLEHRFFSIDIAFPNVKIGLEVNGNQHYNKNGELKEYYEKRKQLIEKNGWFLYDIHFSKVYDEFFVKDLIKKLKKFELNNINFSFYIKEKKINVTKKQKYQAKINPIIKKIEQSNIDFSKFGWVKDVSKLIGISENKGGWWMKKNMEKFYEENCFKRNGGVST